MKEKLTLDQKLYKRKFKKQLFIYNWFYHLVMKTQLKKMNPEIVYKDDIRKEKGACIILWNHLSRLDHAFVSVATYPRRFSMVAAYNEFFRSHLATVFKMMKILPKKNFCVDQKGMKIMLSMIKKNAFISMAPEGLATMFGYNERILPGLGKFLRHCNVPVYFFKFEGQSLAAPVFSGHYRRGGKTKVTIYKMFDKDAIKEFTPERIEEIVQEGISHDEYKWQKENRFKWDTLGNGAEGMGDVCYKCPVCGKEYTMESNGDDLICSSCGLKIHINEYLEFEPNMELKNKVESVSEWVLWQRSEIIKEIRENPDFSVSVNVKIGNIPAYHTVKGLDRSSEVVGEGTLTFDHGGIHYNGKRNGEEYKFDLSYETYCRLVPNINTKIFSLYIDGEYFDFFPDRPCAIKLDLITQEMNRLHFTTWPPLKEHEYLYEQYKK